eukprot:GHVS01028161.1.p1 GENE.GHVS01028161.1~~GHVS01028161.1.p1  ORF type:complete len:704 (+),score=129.27 GHVS01028161.1:94-2205(+)
MRLCRFWVFGSRKKSSSPKRSPEPPLAPEGKAPRATEKVVPPNKGEVPTGDKKAVGEQNEETTSSSKGIRKKQSRETTERTPIAETPKEEVTEEKALSAKQEVPSAKQEVPSAKQEVPSAKEEVPSAKQEVPSAKQEVPSAKQEVPSAKQVVPSAKQEVPSAKQEVPSAKQEVPSAKQEVPSAKQEVPSGKQEVPSAPQSSSASSHRSSTDMAVRPPIQSRSSLKACPGMFITPQHADLSDRYLKVRTLGVGAFGEVVLCVDKVTKAERAVKMIKKSPTSAGADGKLLLEVELLKLLDHPNIMKLYEFFEDNQFFYIVSEVYSGGELFDAIIDRQKFSEKDAANCMKQVLSGVSYLHKHKQVHRDLKPENLLLDSSADDAIIKIVDFGLAAHFTAQEILKEKLGTAYYIAPEVLQSNYDQQCDVWSCGVILYVLLCGYPPFNGATDPEIMDKVRLGEFRFLDADWKEVSEDAKSLIREMLTIDTKKRITSAAALRHKWIVDMTSERATKVEYKALTGALGSMKRFHKTQKLAQAAMLFMGSKLTSVEETKELMATFRLLDTNGDGQLDRNELVDGFSELMKARGADEEQDCRKTAEEEVDRILDLVDFDKNGFIEYSEFVTVCMDRYTLMSKERLVAAFKLFDSDGSGKISNKELAELFGLNSVDDETWHQILEDTDTNKDGEVDLEEFIVMMKKICLEAKTN